MAIPTTQRPGVFSDYTLVRRAAATESPRYAALLATAASGQAGQLVVCDSFTQLADAFGPDSADSCMYDAAALLFAGGASRIYAIAPGIGQKAEPDAYATALAQLAAIDQIGVVVCDDCSQQVLELLTEHLQQTAAQGRERLVLCGIDDSELALTTAQQLANERIAILCPAAQNAAGRVHPLFAPASFAGYLCGLQDLTTLLSGTVLPGITGLSAALDEQTIQSLLAQGVCAMEQLGDTVEVIKAVTTRFTTDGVADLTLSNLSTILIIDAVMRAVRNGLKLLLADATYKSMTLDTIATQATIQLAAQQDAGLLSSFSPPVVYIKQDDPSVCMVELDFQIVSTIHQIHILAHITL